MKMSLMFLAILLVHPFMTISQELQIIRRPIQLEINMNCVRVGLCLCQDMFENKEILKLNGKPLNMIKETMKNKYRACLSRNEIDISNSNDDHKKMILLEIKDCFDELEGNGQSRQCNFSGVTMLCILLIRKFFLTIF